MADFSLVCDEVSLCKKTNSNNCNNCFLLKYCTALIEMAPYTEEITKCIETFGAERPHWVDGFCSNCGCEDSFLLHEIIGKDPFQNKIIKRYSNSIICKHCGAKMDG